jgi:hypothetical protein
MQPRNDLVGEGALCLARPGKVYLVYLPDGGETTLHAQPAARGSVLTWIDPRTGERRKPEPVSGEEIALRAPSVGDWAVTITKG